MWLIPLLGLISASAIGGVHHCQAACCRFSLFGLAAEFMFEAGVAARFCRAIARLSAIKSGGMADVHSNSGWRLCGAGV